MSSKWNIKGNSDHSNINLLNQNNASVWKKAIITSVALSMITFNLAFASEDIESLDKIYHVYLEDTYIGAVSDEEKVKKVIKAKENEASSKFQDYEVDASALVSIVPEQVFSYKTNDNETLEKLNQVLEVQTDAYALEVNGQPVAYLKNQKDYELTLEKLKLEYVPEEKLKQLESNKQSNTKLKP